MAIVNMDFLYHKYRIILAQLNEVPLGELVLINNVSYSPALANIGEFSFSMPKYTTGDSGQREEVPFYNELDSDMLILIDENEYYYINSCIETDSLEETKKDVHAYRRDFELSLKNFNDYSPSTERFLYFVHPIDNPTHGYPWTTTLPTEDRVDEFITSTKDADGLYYGLFNQLEEVTSWRLERDTNGVPIIPTSLQTQVRMITTSETNVLELLKTVQEAWNCIFTYDTINRTIRIVTKEMLSPVPNGVLSDENFIINLSKDFKREEIKTRLFLYNLDGDGVVAEKMAHGHPYMENYDEFRKDKYMSTHLQNALSVYFSTLDALQVETTALWANVKVLITEEQVTLNKIKDWESDLIGPLTTYDHYMSIKDGYIVDEGLPTEEIITTPRELTTEEQARFDEAVTEIDSLNNLINYYTSGVIVGYPRSLKQIDMLLTTAFMALHYKQNKSLMPNVFNTYEANTGLVTDSLMKEIEPYIRDATYKSETIKSADDLYALGKELVIGISKPHLQFTIDVIDFLTLVEFKDAWSLATLGQTLRVENSRLGFVDNIILLRYTHSPETNSLTFEFSNSLALKDDTTYLAELIAKSNTISSQVSFQSSYWSSGGESGSNGNVFDKIYTNFIQTNKLVASEISTLRIETAELYATVASIDYLVANTATIQNLSAVYATINDLHTNYLTATTIAADYADIGLLNVATGSFNTLLANSVLAANGLIANLKVTDANIVSLDAAKINVGVLSVERLVIRNALDPTQSLMFAINNIEGALQSTTVDTLNGEVITNNTIHANKIIADSITAREIAANSITANELLVGTITAASGIIADIDASKIKTGTLDASLVTIQNLTASIIKTGLLQGYDESFFLNFDTGYFNLGNSIIKDADGVRIQVGGQTIQEYVADKMVHSIYVMPAQQNILTDSDGQLKDNITLTMGVSIFNGYDQVPGTLTSLLMRDDAGAIISNPNIVFSLVNPTATVAGSIGIIIDKSVFLPSDKGTINFTVNTVNPIKSYAYSTSWVKAKAGSEPYTIVIYSTNGVTFKNGLVTTELRATIYRGSLDITSTIDETRFRWTRISDNPTSDIDWNNLHLGGTKFIVITQEDVQVRATFDCSILDN